MKNKLGISITTGLFILAVGIMLGLYYARWFWPSAAEYYYEAKHQFDYCPYCGEYIGEK